MQKILKHDLILEIMNLGRPFPKVKYKEVIGLMKYELDVKMIKEFAALRTKTYSYSTKNKDKDKKANGTKSMS